MVEGKTYNFKCDAVDVAPAGNLTLSWLIANELVKRHDYFESTQTPVTRSGTIEYVANGDHNGTQILCEAKLNFGPTGPNLRGMQSNSHELIVHCELSNSLLM